jgi:hypothetical protein
MAAQAPRPEIGDPIAIINEADQLEYIGTVDDLLSVQFTYTHDNTSYFAFYADTEWSPSRQMFITKRQAL